MNYADWPKEKIIERCENLETQAQNELMRGNVLNIKLSKIKEIMEFTDLCDCDLDAKDECEMCDSPFICFEGEKQIREILDV